MKNKTCVTILIMLIKREVIILLTILGFIFVLQLQSCRQYDYDTSPDLRLSFDTDSLLFDTVFTTVGSSTRYFKVYNRNSSRINISQLELAGGSSSYFRINADGRSGTRMNDIEIGPRDSIFIYVEVTVDPTGADLPLVIADSVMFRINNNLQNVKLVAWGQDANFIRPNYTDEETGNSAHVIYENTVWSGPKPYVVYGVVVVLPEVTLTIEKGTRVHLHHRSALQFYPQSSFKVLGTLEEPVEIQGDRLEKMYEEIPGQWGYIWLMATSRDHQIEHAVIKNGTYGLIMDSIGRFDGPTLTIRNSIIKNMDQTGLEFNGAWVESSNTVVANCGLHAILMRWGGNYDFRHLTVANYYNLAGAIRQTPSVVINNYYKDTLGVAQVRPIEKAYFGNSIIHGSLQEELLVDFYPDLQSANFRIEYSLIRTTLQNQLPDKFQNAIFNRQPGFLNTSQQDYRLMENSPVLGAGSPDIFPLIPFDIMGNERSERIDLGAYQYYKIEPPEK